LSLQQNATKINTTFSDLANLMFNEFETAKIPSQYFSSRFGAGIGLDEDEDPFITIDNKVEIANDITFTLQPKLHYPGKFGIQLIDGFYVKDRKIVSFGDLQQTFEIPVK